MWDELNESSFSVCSLVSLFDYPGLADKNMFAQKKFYINSDYPKRIFAQIFYFNAYKVKKKTARVQIEIIRVVMETSAVPVSDYLPNHGIQVSKSVICELIKKKRLI